MSKTEQTAKFFRQHRRRWISAWALMPIGGWCRWRTSVSECRQVYGMDIENKVVTQGGAVKSFYRYRGKAA